MINFNNLLKNNIILFLLFFSQLSFAQEVFDDHVLIPEENFLQERSQQQNEEELITIDIMILFTSNKIDIESLINKANKIYKDSSVFINLRVVHSEQINYSNDETNSSTLIKLTSDSSIKKLRNEKKADLVVLIRPFSLIQQSCGTAWLLGSNNRGSEISKFSDHGYSVVSNGFDCSYFCSDYTFIHELGHNMGLVHDMKNSTSSGAFSFSYGFGIEKKFGTIMSYINPRIGRFSSQEQICVDNIPCGIFWASSSSSYQTDNVKSLNRVRRSIANFRN